MARYDGGEPVLLNPQSRTFWAPVQETTESVLATRWNGQLYAVIGKRAGPDAEGRERWQLRLWWKPFVTLIWYGGMLIALGGVLALIGRVGDDLRRRRRARRYEDEVADARRGRFEQTGEQHEPAAGLDTAGAVRAVLRSGGVSAVAAADDRVASAMIGKPLPDFSLPAATDTLPGVSRADFTDGTPRLLNIWASWCVPCVAEAPQLERLAGARRRNRRRGHPRRPEDVARFLERYGNPYTRIGADNLSALQVAIGSSGVPETFVIDGNGVITYQHIGDIRERDVPVLLAELAKAGDMIRMFAHDRCCCSTVHAARCPAERLTRPLRLCPVARSGSRKRRRRP